MHQVAEGVEDHPVTRNPGLTRETIGDDRYREVSAAVLRPGVACVQMTLVLNEDLFRLETRGQDRFDSVSAVAAHGSTFLNGLTLTLLDAPDST